MAIDVTTAPARGGTTASVTSGTTTPARGGTTAATKGVTTGYCWCNKLH